MNLQLGSFIILAIVFVTIGFIGGALIAIFFSDRGKDEAPAPAAHSSAIPREQEIAVLLRDPETGSLILEMQEKPYLNSKELPDKTRVALLRVAQEWFIWLGGRIESPKTSTGQSKPLTAPKETGAPPEAFSPSQQSAAPAPIAPTRAERKSAAASVSAEGSGVIDMPTKPSSIVEQIDEILQDILIRSELANRKIKLVEDQKNGVIVWVDQKSFMGIDLVDEPEVSALIRQAVADWERRAAPRHS
jgi:hypothetical protein